MAENLTVIQGSKDDKYRELIPQLEALVAGEDNLIANMANISAALKMTFDWLWVGFYLVDNGELVLGPFQGPIACTRIIYGKGVCGTAWAQQATVIVPDVEQFSGHIACSSLSRSEIVVPVKNPAGQIVAVLDVDSLQLADFDVSDQYYLELICNILIK